MELFTVRNSRKGPSRAETQVPEGLRNEFVACSYPILAVKAMGAATCLVLLVSTLGDIGVAIGFCIAALWFFRKVRRTGWVLVVMGRMRCML